MFFIVNTVSVQRTAAVYKTRGAAKAAMTRTKARNGDIKYPASDYTVMSTQEWQDADVMVETHNMLNPGKTIYIRKSEKGTHLDPATERYHSM